MDRQLRILMISLEYPPFVDGGYGVLCGQVGRWLHRRGHTLFVLTTANPADEEANSGQVAVDGVAVRRVLRSYWDGTQCLYPCPGRLAHPYQERQQQQVG
jgi:hypothetical protein